MSAAGAPLVLMMAGGTGGHVYPALAVARELLRRGYRIEWLGTTRGLEQRVVPAAGLRLHHLAVRGVRGKGVVQKLFALVTLLVAALQALWLVLRLSPRCVIGMGGYASGPGGAAAWLLRKPLLVQEQNAVAGTTNRMLAPLAAAVVAGFPGAFRGRVEARVLGNPVRAELVAAGREAGYDFDGSRALRLLVLGGSLGARPINELVPAAVTRLQGDARSGAVEIWHQTGAEHLESAQRAWAEVPDIPVRLAAFIEDMAAAYRWADLVLARAGALTVSELAVMGRPALLVPLPHAIDDHQTANARFLSEAGGARLLPQAGLDAAGLAGALEQLLEQPAALAAMAAASAAAARPEATAAVCDRCEELIRER